MLGNFLFFPVFERFPATFCRESQNRIYIFNQRILLALQTRNGKFAIYVIKHMSLGQDTSIKTQNLRYQCASDSNFLIKQVLIC